jgi:diamine N-acetyltransferase
MTENYSREVCIEFSEISSDDEHFLNDRFLREDQIGFADEPKDTLEVCRKYPNAVPMMAKKGSDLVAFWVCERISEEPITYLIWDFVVHQSYQSLGYGCRILEDLIRHLSEAREAKRVVVGVIPENGTAISLYTKLGFMESGEVNEDGELMFRLDLDGPTSHWW